MYTLGNSITTIQGCIQTCRDNSKPIAVLASEDECYCGDDDTDYQQYGEAVPGETINEYAYYGTQQCSGDNGTEPYIQGCGGEYQFDVYDTTIGACGGQYTGNTGYIYSPNFPGNYSDDQNCIWTITVEDNHIIQLSILMYKISIGDHLDIRDGDDVTAPKITWNSMTVGGGTPHKQCLDSGKWSGIEPQCTGITSISTSSTKTPDRSEITQTTRQNVFSDEPTGTGDTLKYSSTTSEGCTVICDSTLKPSVSSNGNEEKIEQCNQKGANPGVYVGFGIVIVVMAVVIVTLVLLYRRARLKSTQTEEREITNLDKSNDRTYQDLITTDGVNNAYQALNYHDDKNKKEMDSVNTPRPGCYEEIELGQDVSKQKNVVQQQADDSTLNMSEIQEALIVLQQCVTAYDVTTDNEKKGEMSDTRKAMTKLVNYVNARKTK
uniref:Uncharacterized protein LOC102802358 n=1 Tax=Saccoglossus kowalevskii TaxID=10224 RepID=A0ABM0ML53_SACKO|nr:PREDICTED: uncharacterized protein LOC102802358 [Saccoglossus kowalevskii]